MLKKQCSSLSFKKTHNPVPISLVGWNLTLLSPGDHVSPILQGLRGVYNRVRGLGKAQVATTRGGLVAESPMSPVHMVSFLPCCFCATTRARMSLSAQRTAHSHSSPESCYFFRTLSVSHLQSLPHFESMPPVFFSFWKF